MQQDQATVVHSFFSWNTWRWSHFPHVLAACFLPFPIVQQYSPQVILFYHFFSFNVKRVAEIRLHVPKLQNNFTERKVIIESITSNLTSETITTNCFYNFLRLKARNCKSWLLQLLQLLKPKPFVYTPSPSLLQKFWLPSAALACVS